MVTRFGQYLDLGYRMPDPALRSPTPAAADEPGTRGSTTPRPSAPTAVQIAAPVARHLREFAERARAEGGIGGVRFASEVIDRGLRTLLVELRAQLGVAEQFPTPAKTRAPRRPYGGALREGAALEQITVKLDPALLTEARAGLWYLADHDIAPDRVHGIASLRELVTVAVDRLLTELDEPTRTTGAAS